MFRRRSLLLACGLMLARPGGLRPENQGVSHDEDVLVERDPESADVIYTIASDDCRISWTVFGSETNRGVIRHRSDCGLPLAEQAPRIGKVLRKVMEAGAFRTLSWGRLYPDGARDATMALRLAAAAVRSKEWDRTRGVPRGGDINGWVRRLANDASIFEELRPLFRDAGLEIELSSVEKVLVLQAGQLPFAGSLREAGARPNDRVPFDCQVWFSVRPARATGQRRP